MLGRDVAPVVDAHDGAVGHTQQRVMRLVIGARGEKGLIGGHKRQRPAIGQIDQHRLDALFRLRAVALQFDVEPVVKQRLQ